MERFANTCEFCDGDINKCIDPYEYMDSQERFDKISLTDKEDFYTHSNIEKITNPIYKHAKKIGKKFKMKILGKYPNFYR